MKINIPVTTSHKHWNEILGGQVVLHYYDGETIGNLDDNIYMKNNKGDAIGLKNGGFADKESMSECRRSYQILNVELNVK